jgi:hypothetical protein
MILLELFDSNNPQLDDGQDLRQTLKNDAMDILMPFAAHGVPFITMQAVIDKLGEAKSGLVIDRALLMDILNPDEVKIVKKIEGDKIWLTIPEPVDSQREVTQQKKEQDRQKTVNMAQQQAKSQVQAPVAPAPTPPPAPASPPMQ